MLSPFRMVCRDFILPEPASYVFFYAIFNLRNLLYIIRAFRVPPFCDWWMGWRFTTSFGAEKKQETFSDFLLGGAAGGRLVFSFESSGQGGPMMK